MYGENPLSRLAARALGGNPRALAELRRRLKEPMAWLVRWALRSRHPTDPVARRIRAVAGALAADGWREPAVDSQEFIDRVARLICMSMTSQLEARAVPCQELIDTVLV